MLKVVRLLILALSTLAVATSPILAEPQAKGSAPSDQDIANAKAKGLVWVNTESGVYHKEGRYFGHTKQGQFMTEADAQKAGHREAKTEIGEKGSKAATKAAPAAAASTPTKASAPAPAAAAPAQAAAPAVADEAKTVTKRTRKKKEEETDATTATAKKSSKKVEEATDAKSDASADDKTETKRKRKKKTKEEEDGK